jgi:hypothetical protein
MASGSNSVVRMYLTEYHYEILNILDEKYPKFLRKNNLLALLSDKNPDKFEREVKYMEEHKLIEKGEIPTSIVAAIIFNPPLFHATCLRITAKGIDVLKSREEKGDLYKTKRERVERPVAFISASFNDDANELIKWVRNRAENVGFNTLWLKEVYRARPSIDKIDGAINDSDCIIQILTSHVFGDTGEAGWIGNEMGMAFKSRPGNNVVIFVQKGYQPSGLAKLLADPFPLDPSNLAPDEKKAEKYLADLKSKIKTQVEES